MTEAELHAWAEQADGFSMISDYTIPWVTIEHPKGRELALEWMESGSEYLSASGWCTYSGLVATLPDDRLSFDEIQALLNRIVRDIHSAPNHTRQTMNSFVMGVGIYVAQLAENARAAARQIGRVSVDVGDTACEVPLAASYMDKVASAGRLYKKRKTIRC